MSRDWIIGNIAKIEPEIARFSLKRRHDDAEAPCVQLVEVMKREKHLARLLSKRAQASIASLKEPWDKHLVQTVTEQGVTANLKEPRYVEALKEQALALETITTRKLSVKKFKTARKGRFFCRAWCFRDESSETPFGTRCDGHASGR